MPKENRGGKKRRRLPHYKQAIIPQKKIGNYLLNPENPNSGGKPKFFKSIGYNMKGESRLIRDIRTGIATNPAKEYEPNEYGRVNYEVVMKLGVTRKADVITIWAIDKGEKIPRFITAYPYKKRGE